MWADRIIKIIIFSCNFLCIKILITYFHSKKENFKYSTLTTWSKHLKTCVKKSNIDYLKTEGVGC